MNNLKEKAIKGILWRGTELVSVQLVQVISQIIFARLLLPKEFGLIALTSIFIAISTIFIDSGLSTVLIQKKDISQLEKSSVFYFNLVLAVVLYSGIFMMSPYVAVFYDQPDLTLVLRVIALSLILGGFSQVQYALLRKELRFKTIFKVMFPAVTISSTLGIICAFCGYGIWALVMQQLLQQLIYTSGLWISSKWMPSKVFSFYIVKSFLGAGCSMMGTRLLSALFDNIYSIIIGKFFSTSQLGYYSNGRKVPASLYAVCSGAIVAVIFPSFSQLQDDEKKLKQAINKVLTMSMFILTPVLLGFVSSAIPLVRLVLSDKWLPSVPVLCWMSISYLFAPISSTVYQCFKALKRFDLLLKVEIINKVLIIIAIICTYKYGIYAMAAGYAGVSFLSIFINGYYVNKILNYPIYEQLKDIIPILLLGAVMSATVYSLQFSPIRNLYLLLSIQVACGSIIYIAGAFLLKLSSVAELKKIVTLLLAR